MGMYTEFHFNSELKSNCPTQVIDILRYMLGDKEESPALPDHPIFKTDRWRHMLRTDSYYFDADTHSTLRYDDIAEAHFLCIRCNLKNYNGEIEKFVDWIDPYLDKMAGEFLGFSRYEETETPTLLYKRSDSSPREPK